MKITFSNRAFKQFTKLEQPLRERIKIVLRRFESGQRVDIIKKAGESNEYRIRVGGYRLILAKVNYDFIVTEIGKRQNIYK